MTKKIICLMLTLALMLTCAACMKTAPDSAVSGSVSKTTAPEGDGSATDSEDADDEVHIGSIVGSSYKNGYFGIACDFGADWTFYSDDELSTLYETVVDLTNDEEISALLEQNGYAYDMFAYTDNGLVTVNAVIEKLTLLYGVTLSEEDYAELAMDNAVDGLNSMEGYAVQSSELTKVTFAGEEHSAIKLVTTYTEDGYNYDLYQLQVCIKNSNYVIGITFASYIEDITGALADEFYAI